MPLPAPPAAQLAKGFTVVILPAPLTITLPSCARRIDYDDPPIRLRPPPPPPPLVSQCPAGAKSTCPACVAGLDSSLLPVFCASQLGKYIFLSAHRGNRCAKSTNLRLFKNTFRTSKLNYKKTRRSLVFLIWDILDY